MASNKGAAELFRSVKPHLTDRDALSEYLASLPHDTVVDLVMSLGEVKLKRVENNRKYVERKKEELGYNVQWSKIKNDPAQLEKQRERIRQYRKRTRVQSVDLPA